MKQKEFKQKMPDCAAFIEQLAEAFGQEAIHGQIRRGLAGEPTFWAREGGHEVGTRNTVQTSAIHYDAAGVSYSVPAVWILEARQLAKNMGIEVPQADPGDPRAVTREAAQLRAILEQAKSGTRGQ